MDVYNNVPHVGHCHPRVVEAITSQAATLNIHSRYLHTNILDLGEKLIETLPDALTRVFFVNSGSEANELALRIARKKPMAKDLSLLNMPTMEIHKPHSN